jgi:hypothetical protein
MSSNRCHSGEDKRRGKFDEVQLRGSIQPPVEPGLARQRGKEIGRRANSLRAAQEQDSAGIKTVVKERHELLLQLRVKIDEQVSAGHEIELGEGRMHDEILRREDDHLADFLFHGVPAVLILEEKSAQAFLRDILR